MQTGCSSLPLTISNSMIISWKGLCAHCTAIIKLAVGSRTRARACVLLWIATCLVNKKKEKKRKTHSSSSSAALQRNALQTAKEMKEFSFRSHCHVAGRFSVLAVCTLLPSSVFHSNSQLIDQFTSSRWYCICNLYRIPSISQWQIFTVANRKRCIFYVVPPHSCSFQFSFVSNDNFLYFIYRLFKQPFAPHSIAHTRAEAKKNKKQTRSTKSVVHVFDVVAATADAAAIRIEFVRFFQKYFHRKRSTHNAHMVFF